MKADELISEHSINMLAPCGLNCLLCRKALQKENPCLGCNGPNERKSSYCLTQCTIWTCEKRKETDGFCDQCPKYPCSQILEKEMRYASKYPLKESPIKNLKRLRMHGAKGFLRGEYENWRCMNCGGIICVHTGVCSECGE